VTAETQPQRIRGALESLVAKGLLARRRRVRRWCAVPAGDVEPRPRARHCGEHSHEPPASGPPEPKHDDPRE
jgi:hypothetical protein